MHLQKPHRILFSLRPFLSSTLKPNPNPNPIPSSPFSSSSIPTPNSNFSPNDFSLISNLFTNPSISPGSSLHTQLTLTGIKPTSPLLCAVFDDFASSPKLLHSLYLWAENQPGFKPDSTLFSSVIKSLTNNREFHSAWSIVLNQIDRDHGDDEKLVNIGTFAIMFQRYARAGMPKEAIRTFEFVKDKKSIMNSVSEMRFFEKLVSALCSDGYCTEASEYFLRTKETDPGWVPSVRVYNVMLNGWFRARKFKHAERLWEEMKNENVRPSAVTYDTLVKLYCQMGCVEKALKMIGEMTKEGIEPNTTVYNPIIDALAGAGRFEEALGMMERFHVLQIGPDLSTYNSLVKGFCKARDLEGVKKILKNMIESGHDPDRLTYHLVLKMLCLEEKLELAVQVSKQMRHKGHGMNLATSTMLTHLLCKMNKLEDAFAEFEDMIRRGLIPQYLTFQKLNVELMKQGMTEMAQKLCQLMSSVPHSTNLPSTYGEVRDDANARKKPINQKAKACSDC
ncbi:pentatricopeptide repeat-containing protein At5g11310, mitochondrial-like [Trifolium pratense]|uniref:pentatricopeptide repeat-containing protein At5g11310, mitochondrial-like n=1 Tax=Trifolium pratense TaxID=57577 RepID=UPI001E6941BC|nr:pentatricopeptide repeat-containing protein At5g11310, mitochondrial-like [Trifolium pratense]